MKGFLLSTEMLISILIIFGALALFATQHTSETSPTHLLELQTQASAQYAFYFNKNPELPPALARAQYCIPISVYDPTTATFISKTICRGIA